VSWQPDLPQGETFDSQREKSSYYQFLKSPEECDQLKIQKFMQDTYATQRFLLNGENKLTAMAFKRRLALLVDLSWLSVSLQSAYGFRS
jgi:hypothetical protein